MLIVEKHKIHQSIGAGASVNSICFEVFLQKSAVPIVLHVSSRPYVRAVKDAEEAQLTMMRDCAVGDAAD